MFSDPFTTASFITRAIGELLHPGAPVHVATVQLPVRSARRFPTVHPGVMLLPSHHLATVCATITIAEIALRGAHPINTSSQMPGVRRLIVLIAELIAAASNALIPVFRGMAMAIKDDPQWRQCVVAGRGDLHQRRLRDMTMLKTVDYPITIRTDAREEGEAAAGHLSESRFTDGAKHT